MRFATQCNTQCNMASVLFFVVTSKLNNYVIKGSGYNYGIIGKNSTVKLISNIRYPSFLFINIANDDNGYVIYRCLGDRVELISGTSTNKVSVSSANYDITIENNIGWGIPYYVLKM